MKKYLFLMIIGLFLLAGCGSNKNEVVCKGNEKENNTTVSVKTVGKLQNDKINSVSATMTFEDKKTAESYCSLFKLVNSFSEDMEIDVKCSGKTVEIRDYEKILESSETVVKGLTKAEFKEIMQNQGLICK